MNNVMGVIAFIAGAAVGSFVTYKLISKHYEEILEEKEWELEDAKESFAKKVQDLEDGNDKVIATRRQELEDEFEKMKVFDPFEDEEAEEDYVDMIQENEYAENPNKPSHKPYVIKPEEYGDLEEAGYDLVTFTLYADGVIADDDLDVVTTVDETIGIENLNHIGEYASDAVYVRNDKLKYDAEILVDRSNYADVVPKNPRQRQCQEEYKRMMSSEFDEE